MTEANTIKDAPEHQTIPAGFHATEQEHEYDLHEYDSESEPDAQPIRTVGIHDIFGKLEVLAEAGVQEGHRYWLCQCVCGKFKRIKNSKLLTAHDVTCGECTGTRRVAPLPKAILIVHGIAYVNGRKL